MKLDIDNEVDLPVSRPEQPVTVAKNSCWPGYLVLLMAAALVGVYLYQQGYLQHENHLKQTEADKQTINNLQQELADLKRNLQAFERDKEIQSTSHKELHKKFVELEDQLFETREKLLLYEDIFSASDGEKDVIIRHFGLRKIMGALDNRSWSYNLVLSRMRSGEEIHSGEYQVRFAGTEQGQHKVYSHTQLTIDEEVAVKEFTLKHYQSLEGNIRLPDSFTPKTIDIWIIPGNKKLPIQKKSWHWGKLIAE